jgi:hypothetical protein
MSVRYLDHLRLSAPLARCCRSLESAFLQNTLHLELPLVAGKRPLGILLANARFAADSSRAISDS